MLTLGNLRNKRHSTGISIFRTNLASAQITTLCNRNMTASASHHLNFSSLDPHVKALKWASQCWHVRPSLKWSFGPKGLHSTHTYTPLHRICFTLLWQQSNTEFGTTRQHHNVLHWWSICSTRNRLPWPCAWFYLVPQSKCKAGLLSGLQNFLLDTHTPLPLHSTPPHHCNLFVSCTTRAAFGWQSVYRGK